MSARIDAVRLRKVCSALMITVLATGLSAADEYATESHPDTLTFVQGYEVWVPGWVFYDSDDWLALTCTDRDCQLAPAALRPIPASWRGHYDDVATSGQRLEFETSGDAPGEVMAWIQRNDQLSWLATGQLDSYYVNGLSTMIQDDESTYEIVIESSDSANESIGPVLLQSALVDEKGQETHRPNSIYLRLRARGQQQLLTEEMVTCFGELHLDYLLWSGDLDRDGKSDYLINYTDGGTGTVKFYLSSYATDNQLVGIAGIGITHPLDGECS